MAQKDKKTAEELRKISEICRRDNPYTDGGQRAAYNEGLKRLTEELLKETAREPEE